MPTDPSDVHAALVGSARILARGGQLEAKLDALSAQVNRVVGSTVTVVYLLDAGSRTLVPAGGFGTTEEELAASVVTLDEPDDPVARAAVEREPVIRAGGTAPATTSAALRSVQTLVCHPLIADEVAGDAEVQGVLAAGFDGMTDMEEATGALLGAMADLAAVVIRDARLEQALVERSDWLDRMANTDPLTGLANRRTFERILDLEVQRGARQASPLSVILFDVDELGTIRDRDGRDAADDILRVVAATLAELVRLVDTVARVGPDEFAVIAPGSGGETVARRIREAIGEIRTATGEPVTISVGVARFPEQGATATELLEGAGAALSEGRASVG